MKAQKIKIQTNHHLTEGIFLNPENPKKMTVILAHGAGGNMHASFMRFYQEYLAHAGYPCFSFNFPYAQAGKKMPDPQPVLCATFRKAIESIPDSPTIIGGKSMGGRIASYVADHDSVKGLIFLGYPLHAPGKMDRLRDQHLYSIRKPMFFASGTKDPFARMDLLERVIDRIGEYATLYTIDQGGHSFELPKKSGKNANEILTLVAESMLRWISSVK